MDDVEPRRLFPAGAVAGASAFTRRRPTRAFVTKPQAAKKPAFPKTLAEQAAALRAALAARQTPASAEELARAFARANLARVRELLEACACSGRCGRSTPTASRRERRTLRNRPARVNRALRSRHDKSASRRRGKS